MLYHSIPAPRALTLVRTIRAPLFPVFEAWLAPTGSGPWSGATLRWERDAPFEHVVRYAGRDWPSRGRLLEFEPEGRIAHSWVSELTAGDETVVTTTFDERVGQTAVTVCHTGLRSDALARANTERWATLLAGLDALFSG